MRFLKIKAITAFMLAATFLVVPVHSSAKALLNTASQDLAIKGYDPVAYFVMGKAVKGSPEFQYLWNGAFWRFISAEHRQLFEAAPEKYAPLFGGHCAYGVATGKLLDIDPESWTIQDAKLVLFHTKKIRDLWFGDPSVFLEEATEKWREMEGK